MKILVTGAAGFIGSHLAEKLHSLGHTVVGIDSLDAYYSPAHKRHTLETLAKNGVAMHVADLVADDLTPYLEGVEVVYHLAAQPGNSAKITFDTYQRNNLQATHKLLQTAEQSRTLNAFINISTSSVYGLFATCPEDHPPQPISYYGVTKLAAEQLALARHRNKGFPACSLRLFSVYGERERPDKLYPILIKSIANKSEFPLFEGSEEHRRSFTYVGDIVAGFLLVLEHWDRAVGEIFNIGSDISITTGEGIQIVEEIMGQKIRKKLLPKRPGDQLATAADITKARRILGYQPTTTPRQGLERAVRWYMEEIHGKVEY